MIATRLHVKRHSTSALHRPSSTNIRYSSYRRRQSRLPSDDIANIGNIIAEEEDDEVDEVDESTKVEKISF
jgi:hypothetical protein